MQSSTAAKGSDRAPSALKLTGVALLLVGAGCFLLQAFKSDIPKPNVKPFTSLGSLAADETAALIGRSGSIAIVSEIPDPKSPSEDAMVRSIKMVAAEVDGFKATLQSKGNFTYQPELKLVRPSNAMKTVWPAGEFLRLLQKHPSTTTIVAFCYLPGQLSPTERSLLQSRTGKLIIVGGVVPEVKPLVDQRVAHLAVSSMVPVPQPPDASPESPHAWVRRVYVVLKP